MGVKGGAGNQDGLPIDGGLSPPLWLTSLANFFRPAEKSLMPPETRSAHSPKPSRRALARQVRCRHPRSRDFAPPLGRHGQLGRGSQFGRVLQAISDADTRDALGPHPAGLQADDVGNLGQIGL